MKKRAPKTRPETLRNVIHFALEVMADHRLDSKSERQVVCGALLGTIQTSPDAVFLRETLGLDPRRFVSRAKKNDELLEEVCYAALRLAGVISA